MMANEVKEKILNEIAAGATAQSCAEKYNISPSSITSKLKELGM
jgi:DNA-binding CsgD family transcriptional regulator